MRATPRTALVRREIEGTYLSPAEVRRLPSERALAERLGVARGTVRAALAGLERDGLVTVSPGSGAFVIGPYVTKATTFTSFTQDAVARGWVPSTRVLEVTSGEADEETASALGIAAGAGYHRLRRLRLADAVPLAVEDVALPAALVPDLPRHDLTGSLFAVLSAEYGLRMSKYDRVVSAVALDPATADLLDVEAGSPTLRVRQTGFDQHGRPVELARSVYRADRYDFRSTVWAPADAAPEPATPSATEQETGR